MREDITMKKILIIVDMQKDFTNGVLGNAECEAAVQKIANIVNQEFYDFICLTRDTHYDNYLDTHNIFLLKNHLMYLLNICESFSYQNYH